MGIHVYGSNRLEDLACTMAKVMKANKPEDPLQRIPIVIHSSGMARWLSQEIAKSGNGGLSANMELIFPGKFFQKWVFEPMDRLSGIRTDPSSKTDELPFNPETIKLLIMKALCDGLEKSEAFGSVNNYLGDGDDIEIRRYQISARVARLFDRYMNYRPEMLKEWQDGKTPKTEEWQRDLWNSLIKSSNLAKSYSNYFWDFMNHHSPSNVLADLHRYPAVYVFGLSAMPPAQLAILQKISGSVPVHFFWMNPCNELWDQTKSEKEMEREIMKIRGKDIFRRCEELAKSMEELVKGEAGNPMLGALGRVGRELHRLLLNCDGVEEHNYWVINKNPQHLLYRLQDDILKNTGINAEKAELLSGDDSISINNCYGPLREAEALYEFLIRAFDKDQASEKDEKLLPKDIVVYVPDMEQYAPAIEAVFGGGSPAIPFIISDRTLTREYPSCAAFLGIIKLLGSRIKASEVLSIWSFQEVRDMAGISDDDWDLLQRLLKDARVAWGIDEIFREKISGCKFRQNSWRFALDRLIFGAVMMDSGNAGVSPCFNPGKKRASDTEMAIAPLEDAEVYSRLIGSVAGWLESLFGIQKIIDGGRVRKSYEWLEVLDEISMRFLPSSNRDDGVLAVKRTLGSMREQLETAELLDMEISWDLATLWIRERIESEANDEKFCCGLLTFCRFQPMRGIPSRIVCMLGMNDSVFPRQDKRLGFDLMDPKIRHLCDRWGKDDDRYAFLEAILAAREKLYISYTGRRDTDKQEMPPSILVTELISYLESRVNTDMEIFEKSLIIQHPLHPFSQEYFVEGKTGLPQSSSISWCRIAEKLYFKRAEPGTDIENKPLGFTAENTDSAELEKTAEDAQIHILSVRELVKFFESPCKHYYEKIVGIDLNIREIEQPADDEPSELEHLQQYAVRNGIYEAYKKKKRCERNDLYIRKQAEGALPFGAVGLKIFDRLWDETEEWIAEVKKKEEEAGEMLAPIRDVLELDISGTKLRLSYEIKDLHKNFQFIARPSNVKPKDILNLAVLHAIVRLLRDKGRTDLPEKSVFLGLDENKELLDLAEPEAYLRDLARLYLDGHKKALCFWLDTAAKAMSTGLFDNVKAKEAWEPEYNEKLNYVKPDEYTVRAYGEKLPEGGNLEELQEIAGIVFRFEVPEKNESETPVDSKGNTVEDPSKTKPPSKSGSKRGKAGGE